MFTSTVLNRYANVLFWGLSRAHQRPFSDNDVILIRFAPQALPLAEELYSILLHQGQRPALSLLPTAKMEHSLYTQIQNEEQFHILPGEKELYEHLAGSITLSAPERKVPATDISMQRISTRQQARRALQDITRQREEQGLYSWTLGIWPTESLANQAGCSLLHYANLIEKACFLDYDNPLRQWQQIADTCTYYKERLNALGNSSIHIEADDGTDLRFSLGEKRCWAGMTGRNIPSFELYISPDWRTVQGTYNANLPTFRNGIRIESVRLTFNKGTVQHATASSGNAFLQQQLQLDEGASRLGEFALVDKRHSCINHLMANTLYDENHGGEHGSMHIALGQSYANTYADAAIPLSSERKKHLGFNQSLLHWDFVATTPRRVTASIFGKHQTIYENGMFTL